MRAQNRGHRIGDFCEEAGILPEAQHDFRPQRSTTNMMFVVRRLQKLERVGNTSLEICFIDLAKAYDSVDRSLLWEVLARFGIPPWMIKVIRMFHDVMRAHVQLIEEDFSARFNVCQGLRQGYVLSPLLFSIFFAAVIIMVLQRSVADTVIVSDLVYEPVPITLVPNGRKVVGIRWVYKIKAEEVYMSRLVVLGWSQVPWSDCGGTFPPVCRLGASGWYLQSPRS